MTGLEKYTVNYTEKLSSKMAFTAAQFLKLSYFKKHSHIHRSVRNTDFNIKEIIDLDNTRLIIAQCNSNPNFLVFTFSGTKNDGVKDYLINLNCSLTKTITNNPVHRGWYAHYLKFQNIIKDYQKDKTSILWAGHSRGAALAAISQDEFSKGVVYSFGSPRYTNKLWRSSLLHYRFYFDNDPVIYLPPRFLGYRHTGIRIKIPENSLFNDKEFEISDLNQREFSRDWRLISHSVKDWLRGKPVSQHHKTNNYCKCFKKL